jgi:hypothetical protein
VTLHTGRVIRLLEKLSARWNASDLDPFEDPVSCLATIDTPVERVKEACEKWACRFYWHQTADNPDMLAYHLYRRDYISVWRWRGPDMTVSLAGVDDRTSVAFNVSAGPKRADAAMARFFASIVCSDLAAQGAAVLPAWLGDASDKVERVKTLSNWWARLQIPLWIAFLGCFVGTFVCVGLNAGDVGLALFCVAMLSGSLMDFTDGIRERNLGRPRAPIRLGFPAAGVAFWTFFAAVAVVG